MSIISHLQSPQLHLHCSPSHHILSLSQQGEILHSQTPHPQYHYQHTSGQKLFWTKEDQTRIWIINAVFPLTILGKSYLPADPVPNLPDSCSITNLANSSGKSCPCHCGGNLRVDPNLEPCRTPVNKSDSSIIPNPCYGTVDVLRHHITSIQQAAGHVKTWTVVSHAQLAVWREDSFS